MEPPDPSFADEFNVSQEDVVLVFDLRRTAGSRLFQVHRPHVCVEAGMNAFPDACFEFTDEGPEEAQHGILANLLNISASCCGVITDEKHLEPQPA